jgi:DNA primase
MRRGYRSPAPVCAIHRAFNADKSVNHNDNVDHCFACHKSQERQDFVFRPDRMKSAIRRALPNS